MKKDIEKQAVLFLGAFSIFGGILMLDLPGQYAINPIFAQLAGITPKSFFIAGTSMIVGGGLIIFLYVRWFGGFKVWEWPKKK